MKNESIKEKSIFTQIIERYIPSNIVYEDDLMICIWDIKPKYPVHLLCITKVPYQNYQEFIDTANSNDIIRFFKQINITAKQFTREFTLITNNGKDMGQEIFHFHVHIVGLKIKEQPVLP